MELKTKVLKTYCTSIEAAKILGVSHRTVQLWVDSGVLEAWKTYGGHRRIVRASINRLLYVPVAGGQGATGAAGPARKPRRFSILVIKDRDNQRCLREFDKTRWSIQHHVETVGDGYEALIRLGQSTPDLLITDLQMLGIDGQRMLTAINATPALAGMTIIALSGASAADAAPRARVPARIHLLPKPLRLADLKRIAENTALARVAGTFTLRPDVELEPSSLGDNRL